MLKQGIFYVTFNCFVVCIPSELEDSRETSTVGNREGIKAELP